MLEYENWDFAVPKILSVDDIKQTALCVRRALIFAQVVCPILSLILCEMVIENLLSQCPKGGTVALPCASVPCARYSTPSLGTQRLCYRADARLATEQTFCLGSAGVF